jgi:hypothetical protein
MLPNGDFEADAHEAFKITNWIKIKEKGANGGGIIGNGSDPAATGWPGYPFDNANKYFKSQAFGNVGFALVNSYAIEVRGGLCVWCVCACVPGGVRALQAAEHSAPDPSCVPLA